MEQNTKTLIDIKYDFSVHKYGSDPEFLLQHIVEDKDVFTACKNSITYIFLNSAFELEPKRCFDFTVPVYFGVATIPVYTGHVSDYAEDGSLVFTKKSLSELADTRRNVMYQNVVHFKRLVDNILKLHDIQNVQLDYKFHCVFFKSYTYSDTRIIFATRGKERPYNEFGLFSLRTIPESLYSRNTILRALSSNAPYQSDSFVLLTDFNKNLLFNFELGAALANRAATSEHDVLNFRNLYLLDRWAFWVNFTPYCPKYCYMVFKNNRDIFSDYCVLDIYQKNSNMVQLHITRLRINGGGDAVAEYTDNCSSVAEFVANFHEILNDTFFIFIPRRFINDEIDKHFVFKDFVLQHITSVKLLK